MQVTQSTKCSGNGETLALTKQQVKDIKNFKNSLKHGEPESAFEGTLLEGVAFLKGAMQIVEAVNH